MFKLPPLPYGYGALAPAISERTLKFHHDKHHAKYVETLNSLLAEQKRSPADLESVVRRADDDPAAQKLFNNAAQAWNHGFFWVSMSPDHTKPDGALMAAIKRDFGDLTALGAEMVKTGVGHFGSGWLWLACEEGKLKVIATHDADDPLTERGLTPLITCDLWEHAYYLDYQHERDAFVKTWFDKLANWRFAGQQFAAATGQGELWRYPAPAPESEAKAA